MRLFLLFLAMVAYGSTSIFDTESRDILWELLNNAKIDQKSRMGPPFVASQEFDDSLDQEEDDQGMKKLMDVRRPRPKPPIRCYRPRPGPRYFDEAEENDQGMKRLMDVRRPKPPICIPWRPRPRPRPVRNFDEELLEAKVQEIQRLLSHQVRRPKPPKGGPGRPKPKPKPTRKPPTHPRPYPKPPTHPKPPPTHPKPYPKPPTHPRPPTKKPRPTRGGPPHPTRAPRPPKTRGTPRPHPTTLAPPVSKWEHFVMSPGGQRVQEVFFEVLTTTGVQILRRWLDPTTGNTMAEDYVDDMNVNYPPRGMGGDNQQSEDYQGTDNEQVDDQGDYQGTDNQQGGDNQQDDDYPPYNDDDEELGDYNNGNY